MKQNIYFIGFMGTGKSTVSKALAADIGYQEIDTDYEIAEKKHMRIPEIFEKYGEAYFRSGDRISKRDAGEETLYYFLWRRYGTSERKCRTYETEWHYRTVDSDISDGFEQGAERERTSHTKRTHECGIYR